MHCFEVIAVTLVHGKGANIFFSNWTVTESNSFSHGDPFFTPLNFNLSPFSMFLHFHSTGGCHTLVSTGRSSSLTLVLWKFSHPISLKKRKKKEFMHMSTANCFRCSFPFFFFAFSIQPTLSLFTMQIGKSILPYSFGTGTGQTC